ncbi:MAG: ECF transporter S component [Candidatus Limnocylindria bacterium]
MRWGTFDTRTLVLIPIAIAINIVLGQTVASVLKVPVYLDSIGTVLVGVLAGPIPGLVTGLLSNLLWTYVLPAPFNSQFAAPFAPVAAFIGFFAGLVAQWGFFRSRPNADASRTLLAAVVVIVVIGAIGYYGFIPFYTDGLAFFNPDAEASPVFTILGYLIGLGFVAAIVGLIAILVLRRDLGVAYVAIAGLVCGIVSALISAPIAAGVFGGVTGSGTDFLVAAFQQAGSDLSTAVLQQGLLSDPIDKTVTFFVVFVLLQALSRRFVARFPQGEQAVGLESS